jgi:hypothetical protein
MAGKFQDLLGTLQNYIRLGLTGARLVGTGGNLTVRNPAGTADANVTAARVDVSGDVLVLNSDAAGAGSDRTYSIQRGGGITQNTTLILPSTGTAGQAMVIKAGSPAGTIELEPASLGVTNDKITKDTTSIAFGSASPVAMFTLPANAVIGEIRVIVDTAFDGSPSLSIGTSGAPSKYMTAGQVDLKAAASYEVFPDNLPGAAEALIATYAAGGATVGAGRIEVEYAIPV